MRIQVKYPAIALCAVLLASAGGCSQEEAPGRGDGDGMQVPLVIATAGVQAEVTQTRATTPLPTDASIGVFLTNPAGSSAYEPVNNIQYTFDSYDWYAAGYVIRLQNANADLCAYYPYNASVTSATGVHLEPHIIADGEVPLAYATTLSANATSGPVTFTMKQAYAWLELSFKRDAIKDDITLGEFSLAGSGLNKDLTLDISSGNITHVQSAAGGTITFPGDIALPKSGTVVRNIALPVSYTSGGVKVGVKVKEYGNRVLSTTLARLTELIPGYKYAVTITVNGTALDVTSVEVLPWTQTTVNDGGKPLEPAGTERPPVGIWVAAADINLGGTACTDQDKQALGVLTWAEGNLISTDNTKPYEWAPSQTDSGVYYTWMSTYTGNINQNNTDPCSKLDETKYGTGWRTPTRTELERLTRCTDRAIVNGGMWFMNSTSGLFLPAAGSRLYYGGSGTTPTNYPGTRGYYWSSRASGSYDGCALGFESGDAGVYVNSSMDGFPVRCVKG